jgi:hypothetical protein
MYDKVKTSGEKASKTEKVTAKELTKTLTSTEKNALRGLESPHLCRSNPTAAIHIRFRVDWCMMTAKKVVRRYRKTTK